jgi:S1-C subfamily serine protease
MAIARGKLTLILILLAAGVVGSGAARYDRRDAEEQPRGNGGTLDVKELKLGKDQISEKDIADAIQVNKASLPVLKKIAEMDLESFKQTASSLQLKLGVLDSLRDQMKIAVDQNAELRRELKVLLEEKRRPGLDELDTAAIASFWATGKWKPGRGVQPAHIPQGTDLPTTEVMALTTLGAKKDHAANLPEGDQYRRMSERVPTLVVFQRVDAELESGRVVGNGVLVGRGRVLTAKHVAEQVQREAKRNNLAVFSFEPNGAFHSLEFTSAEPYSTWMDPDLAMVSIKDVPSLPLATWRARGDDLAVGSKVFFVGSWELSSQPNVGTGIVTTSVKHRQIAEQLQLTVQGTSIGSFAGQSGSPVFDAATGDLYGIFVAGWKWFGKSGETVFEVPTKDQWDSFAGWSWIVPVHKYGTWVKEKGEAP